MEDNIIAIRKHLEDKNKYTKEYIDRVCDYMERHEDLAAEFVSLLPKNVILDDYIKVRGYSIQWLGAKTLLSRSAIYVVLARLREEEGSKMDDIVKEEFAFFEKSIAK